MNRSNGNGCAVETPSRRLTGRNAKEMSAFLETIFESSTEYSIIGKDLDGQILLWNEGARRLYGYDAEEVADKRNSAILHTPEDLATGKTCARESRHHCTPRGN